LITPHRRVAHPRARPWSILAAAADALVGREARRGASQTSTLITTCAHAARR